MTFFFNPLNGLIPFRPDYPNSLLIILAKVCDRSTAPDGNRGRRGSIGAAQICMSIAVNYRARQENIASAYRPCVGRIARVEVFDDMARRGAVLACARGRRRLGEPLTSASTFWLPGSAMSVPATVSCRSS